LPRYEDDFSALAGPVSPPDFWDPVKFIALNQEKTAWISFGGEFRLTYERAENYLWGDGPQDDGGYFLQRALLHADLKTGPHLRLFAQLQSSLSAGRRGGPRLSDRDEADILQAFAELSPWPDLAGHPTLRVGRQEIQYGTGRLMAYRDGSNIRRSFDAARLLWKEGEWRGDLFLGRPVEVDRHYFDNQALDEESVYGAVVAWTGAGPGVLEGFVIGHDRDPARFAEGFSGDTRHTFGLRYSGRASGWDWIQEAAGQVGSFGSGDTLAWSVSTDHGYTWTEIPTTPRLGLQVAAASGDQVAGDGRLETYAPPYPRGNLYGDLTLVGIPNIIQFQPSLTFRPTQSVRIFLAPSWFWRESLDDALYSPPHVLRRPPGHSRAAHVGTQLEAAVTWQIDPHWSVSAKYARFLAGRFLEETGAHQDIDFIQLRTTYKF
jgi:hypothetical protein